MERKKYRAYTLEEQAKRSYPRTREDYYLDSEELASNASPQTPVLVCLDCSYSMRQNRRLQRVLEGLEQFRREIAEDPIAADSLQLAIVAFQGEAAREAMPFSSAARAQIPQLVADGITPLGDGVKFSMELIRKRVEQLKLWGNTYYRPWLIVISDGDDTGDRWELEAIGEELRQEWEQKHLSVKCITVGEEDSLHCNSLRMLAPDHRLWYLRDLNFTEFFDWLSKSVEKKSQSLQSEASSLIPDGDWGEEI